MAPIKTFQINKKYCPWLSENIKKLILKRNIAQKIASESQNQDDWKKFKELRNNINGILKKEKNQLQKEKLQNCCEDSG